MRLVVASSLVLAACATPPDGEPEGNAPATPYVEGIEYETGPCFGACPVYRIALNADGTALFEGRGGAALIGERSFRITPAQYRVFARHLASLRPRGDEINYSDAPLCGEMATDMPSVTVTWYWPDRRPQRLHFYYGCDMERYRDIAERLRGAPGLLPVGDFIGRP